MNKKIVISLTCLVFFAICGILISNRITAKEIKDGIVLGNKYYQDGKYEEAIIAFNGVIKIDSKNIDARAGLVQAYTKVNKPTEATRIAKEAININVKNPQGYLKIAKAYENVDKIDEAIKILTEGYRETKDDAIKKKLEELVAAALAKNLKVDVDLEELVKNPDAHKYFEDGMAYSKINEYDKATDSFSKAINLDATFDNAYYQRSQSMRAVNWMDKGLAEKALVDLGKAIDLDSKNADYYDSRGLVYSSLSLRQYDKAEANFAKSIELKPTEGKYYLHRGNMYNSEREGDKALSDALKAVELNPDDLDGYLLQGEAYNSIAANNRSLNFADKQIIIYTKAVTLKGTQLYRAYAGRANAYQRLDNLESALADITKAITLATPNKAQSTDIVYYGDDFKTEHSELGNLYARRASVYMGLNNNSAALSDFNEALKLSPNDGYILEQRGHLYVSMHENSLAIADITNALNSVAVNTSESAEYKKYLQEEITRLQSGN